MKASISRPPSVMTLPARALRFWSANLALLNLTLLGMACLLYGSPHLRGELNFIRAETFLGQADPSIFDSEPGIDNVLAPAIAASLGLSRPGFLVMSIVPYVLFIWGVCRYVSRRGGRTLGAVAAVALYTSGLVPYMVGWGGFPDGFAYLALLPILFRPNSLAVYAAAFVVQCLNHYLGAVALAVLAAVWYSWTALQASDAGLAWRHARRALIARAIVSVAILAAFLWFWNTRYPTAAGVRLADAAVKLSVPLELFREIGGPFPWTLLSTLKLTIVPVAWLALAAPGHRRLGTLVVAAPFAAALMLTCVFVDVTRIATMVVMPALLLTLQASGADSPVPPARRRRLRRLLLVTALLNLLVPNYYVNNGRVVVAEPLLVIEGLGLAFGSVTGAPDAPP